jgi:hypothetical protein
MSLLDERIDFTRYVAELIDFANATPGYAVTLGEVVRSAAAAAAYAKTGAGISNSLHCDGLAVDLNLYKDGVWKTQTSDFAWLGAYWKSLDPRNRWGGDFTTRPDGNHFSLTPDPPGATQRA